VDKYKYTSAVLFVMCQKGVTTPSTVALWNYFVLRDGTAIKLDEITLHTTLSKKPINNAIKLLEKIGVLIRERDSVTQPYIYTLKPLKPKNTKVTEASTPPYYYNNILDTINLTSLLDNKYSKFTSLLSSSTGESAKRKKGIRVKDILEDEDWPTVTKMLENYFTLRELKPTDLVYRNRWDRVCRMLYSEDFNLDLYAEWYKNAKYDRLGFAWGLFTSKSMREEFQRVEQDFVARKQRSERRINTTTKWAKERKINKQWMEELEDVED
jgi:hypothetical protein